MRVTNSTMINTLLTNLGKSMSKMTKLEEQASTGKRINRPSDDPVGLNRSMRLKTSLSELDKYSSNASDAKSWLESTESALSESKDVLDRVRELTIQAANDDLNQTDRDAIVAELKELKDHMVQVANSTYEGRYLFSGTQTQTPAFSDDGVYQGNTDSMEYELSVGVKVPVNVDGQSAFGGVFDIMDTLIDDVTNGNTDNLSGNDLENLDTVINQQLEITSDVGARVNRADLIINRADELTTNMTSLLSDVEDADYAEVSLEYASQQSIYNAALEVGAKIIQPTLLDYIS